MHVQFHSSPASLQAPTSAIGFRAAATKWLVLVRLLLGEIPGHLEFVQPGLQQRLQPYYEITQAVRVGDLSLFRQALHRVSCNMYDLNHSLHAGQQQAFCLFGQALHRVPHDCCAQCFGWNLPVGQQPRSCSDKSCRPYFP